MGDFADDYGGYDFYDRMELDEQRYQERKAQRAKLLTLPKPEQKPMHPELRKMWEDHFDKCFRAGTQRTWVGLTEKRIKEIWLNGKDHGDDWRDVLALARSFEAELKELNK
jgi:hypothetical protein